MKQVTLKAFGNPLEVLQVEERPDLTQPGFEEVVVKMAVFPINPADLLTAMGIYGQLPSKGETLGIEGVGHIQEAGKGVTSLKKGDRVICLTSGNWAEMRRLPQNQVIKVSPDGNIEQQAMLKVNPSTAWRLLHEFTPLQPGDLIAQNAANSSVGFLVGKIASKLGMKTVNIVRSHQSKESLEKLGIGAVFTAGEIEAPAFNSLKFSAALALDSVAGPGTRPLVDLLRPNGTIVVFGGMSGENFSVSIGDIVFKQLQIKGFWMAKRLETGYSRPVPCGSGKCIGRRPKCIKELIHASKKSDSHAFRSGGDAENSQPKSTFMGNVLLVAT